MKNPKVILPLVVVVALAVVWKTVLSSPPPHVESKVDGEVYVLPREFVVNLAAGGFAKLSVGLVIEPGSAAGHGEEAKPPEGYGPLPQEGLVREIITDTLTGEGAPRLIEHRGRHRLEKAILGRLRRTTDVAARQVVITDLAVQ